MQNNPEGGLILQGRYELEAVIHLAGIAHENTLNIPNALISSKRREAHLAQAARLLNMASNEWLKYYNVHDARDATDDAGEVKLDQRSALWLKAVADRYTFGDASIKQPSADTQEAIELLRELEL